jgi:hypothetical protein
MGGAPIRRGLDRGITDRSDIDVPAPAANSFVTWQWKMLRLSNFHCVDTTDHECPTAPIQRDTNCESLVLGRWLRSDRVMVGRRGQSEGEALRATSTRRSVAEGF